MDTRVFEALADENRLAIVQLLADGEKCVCDVADALGISGALASHHVKRLRDAGLVTTRRSGTWLHCGLDHDTLRSLSIGLTELADRRPRTCVPCCATGLADVTAERDDANV